MVTTLHSSSPCQKSVETSFGKTFLTEQSYPWWCTHRATATGGIKFSSGFSRSIKTSPRTRDNALARTISTYPRSALGCLMPTSSARVEAWKSAWESRDPARVVALYTRDATHQSALIAKIYPQLGRLPFRAIMKSACTHAADSSDTPSCSSKSSPSPNPAIAPQSNTAVIRISTAPIPRMCSS